MSYITLKCKNCGSNMSLNTESHSATCNHCGSTFLLADILDEKDIDFAKKFTPKNIEQKMRTADALKQGETYLYQAEYEKAEASFKKAIELDDSNYKPYLGVVKAKTHNLNYIPENDDYIQYAKYALDLANGDDYTLVKSELAKIELLRREDIRQDRIRKQNLKQQQLKKMQKKAVSKFFNLILISILLVLAAFIFISSFYFNDIIVPTKKRSKINIEDYETLTRVLNSYDYLDYEINLTKDIDCQSNTISALGDSNHAFTGIFNGNYHTISNALIKNNHDNFLNATGLFAYTKNAKISNLILSSISITLNDANLNTKKTNAGILVGLSESSTFNNIEIKNSCSLVVSSNIEYTSSIGGAIGYATGSNSIQNISCHTSISASIYHSINTISFYIGGIVGYSNNSIVKTCCSNSSITTNISNSTKYNSYDYVGGIVGYVQGSVRSQTTNYSSNLYSGSITATGSSKVNYAISAIASNGNLALTDQNNYCLFTSSNFVRNSVSLESTDLKDYTTNSYFVHFINSNSNYISKQSTIFSSQTWDNLNTFTPSLKQK